MITRREFGKAQRDALSYLHKAGVILTEDEKRNIDVIDYDLGDLAHIGLEVVTYVSTERYCAKELVLFPRQICPEHRHADIDGEPGKEETFRCRWGTVYLYIPGEPTPKPHCTLPKGRKKYFTTRHEITLKPGRQHTLPPNTLHWFQAGDEGAVVSEFSSKAVGEKDVFTDPDIWKTGKRLTKIADT